MNLALSDKCALLIKVFALSMLTIVGLFFLEGRIGFNLWDEGFLWYGAQHILQGEVPIRDFMAYDPGRYYWSALFMSILGNSGIMALRESVAVFQLFGLVVALYLITLPPKKINSNDLLFLVVSSLTLAVWMFPRHKLFDISLSIFLVGILTSLVRRNTLLSYFTAGIGLGFVAVFGRNHGIYGLLGGLGVLLWLSLKSNSESPPVKGLICWGAGIVCGFLPVLLMVLLVPGFAVSFFESIKFLFEQQATNLPLPIPWPWTVNFRAATLGQAINGVLVGIFFIGTLLFGASMLLWVFYRKFSGHEVSPVLVATSVLALPYAHYAYSRADVGHLAQGIFPMLIGLIVVTFSLRKWLKWSCLSIIFFSSMWVSLPFHPAWQCKVSVHCEKVKISGSNLLVEQSTTEAISLLRKLSGEFSPGGESFLVVPYWPGAYALLDRKSPMWEIYPLFSRSPSFESKEIERIKKANPQFVLVFDSALDGNEELRYRNTHPLTHKYVLDSFDAIQESPNPAYQIYKAKMISR